MIAYENNLMLSHGWSASLWEAAQQPCKDGVILSARTGAFDAPATFDQWLVKEQKKPE